MGIGKQAFHAEVKACGGLEGWGQDAHTTLFPPFVLQVSEGKASGAWRRGKAALPRSCPPSPLPTAMESFSPASMILPLLPPPLSAPIPPPFLVFLSLFHLLPPSLYPWVSIPGSDPAVYPCWAVAPLSCCPDRYPLPLFPFPSPLGRALPGRC